MSQDTSSLAKGKCNSSFDISNKMIPFLDIHMVLPIFDWLEDSKISSFRSNSIEHLNTQMYRENEIAKARLALLNNTNMVEYAMDEFKKIHKTEDVPEEMENRNGAVMKQYESIKKSKLSECAESCYSELNETKVIPVLSDAELEEYGIQREELDKCMDYGKFLMNCGLYQDALIMITFYMAQLPRTTCKDLFQDRLMNCYWGRLTCEILIDEPEGAQNDLRQMEQYLNQVESSVPAAQILQSRCWLLHYSLYLFSRYPEDIDQFVRLSLRREYLAAMEINCPWLLRYVAVVAVVQNRQNLARVVDILDRRQESLEDPLLLFLHSLLIRMDFEAASKELGRCPDVFESDFFLRVNGEELLQSFMENAQLLVLELLFHVQRSITMENLAQTVSMSMTECEKWVKELVEKDVMKMTISEKGYVTISKATPSVYEQVMEKSKELEQRINVMQKILTSKRE
ncbi:hypothetical protein WA171_003140, partial [Blastocystis sp. BT1]